jgi:hypothetical protein
MILSGTTRALTVLGLAGLLLPAVAAAEEPPRVIEPGKPLEVEIELVQNKISNRASDVQALEAELQKKLAEIRELEARIKQAQEKARSAEAPRTAPGGDVIRLWQQAGGEGKVLILRDAQVNPGAAAPQAKGTLYELVHGEKGTLILRPVSPQPQAYVAPMRIHLEGERVPATPVPGQPIRIHVEGIEGALNLPGQAPAVLARFRTADGDPRAKDLDQRLDAIMKELEQLRKEIRGTRALVPVPPLPVAPPGIRFEVKPEPTPKPKPEEQGEEARKIRELREQQRELQKIMEELQKAVERKGLIEGPQKK